MLKETLNKLVEFDPESLERLLSCFVQIKLGKGKAFANKGEYSKNIGFVEKGVLRAYYRNDKGEEYN